MIYDFVLYCTVAADLVSAAAKSKEAPPSLPESGAADTQGSL